MSAGDVVRVPAIAGKVTGRLHNPAEGDKPEEYVLFVEAEGQPTRYLVVSEAAFDWVRMGDAVLVDDQGAPVCLSASKTLKGATWQP